MKNHFAKREWSGIVRYGVVPIVVGIALVCRLALNPILDSSSPFMFFLVAIILCSWLGGIGPGVFAVVLSWLAVDYHYLDPIHSFALYLTELIHSLAFFIPAVIVCLIVARIRREQANAEKAAGEARANEAEARNSEERLRKAQERALFFSTVLEDSEQPFAAGTPDGRLTFYNHAFIELTGYSAEELSSRSWSTDLTPPEWVERENKIIGEMYRTGQSQLYQKEYIRKDGTRVPLEIKLHLVRNEQDKPEYYYAFLTDITERKRSEEALRESEYRYRSLFENSIDAIFMTLPEGNILAANPAACAMFGMSEAEIRRVGRRGLIDPDDPRHETAMKERAKTGFMRGEFNYMRSDGSKFTAEVSSVVLPDKRAFVILRDITERKRAEQVLRQNEERFRSLITASSYAVYRASPHWEEMLQLYGRDFIPDTESPSATWLERYVIPEDQERVMSTIREAIRTKSVYELEHRVLRVDGSTGWTLSRAIPLLDEDGNIVEWFGTASDINDRKRAEEALRDSERRLRTIFESNMIGIMYWSVSGRVTDANNRFLQMIGYSRADLEQGHVDWNRLTPPEFAEADGDAIASMKATGVHMPYEKEFYRSDGSRVPTIVGGATLNEERTEGVSFVLDITERKQAEEALRVANERLLESDRRKDEFIAQLAHELRNPLAPIRYAVQMLNMNGAPEERQQQQRNVIDRQISHMGRLLDDLLDISRITRGKITLKRETVDLRSVARQALESLRPMIESRGQHLYYEEPAEPISVDGDPTRLEQIIHNLLHNAHKYTEAGGCISLRLQAGDNQQAVIHVVDSGIGIPPEIIPRIFEAFVQGEQGLARSQGGLGIGLAMVKTLVQMHGGSVEARSAGIGRGSEFFVRLPIVAEMAGRVAPAQPSIQPSAKSRRVLVVDDNEDSAASLGELLSLWGHKIQTAFDGTHALEAAHEWRPEIILLDIGLPGMDGYEVARRLRRDSATSGAFLVAVTGYGQDEDRRRSQEAGFNQHLTKPVELEKLQDLLQEAEAA